MLRSLERVLKPLKFTYFSLFALVVSALLLFILMVGNVQQETYELKEFQIAPEAIRSLKTVEDTVKTEQERDRAANEVLPVYQFSEDIAKNRQAIVVSIFDFFIEVKKEIGEEEEALETSEDEKVDAKAIDIMRDKLSGLEKEEPNLQLSDAAIGELLAMNVEVLEKVKEAVVKVLGDELTKPLRTQDLTLSKYEIERNLKLTNEIPAKIEQPVTTIARALLVETEVLNEALTTARRDEAKASVDPIRILQGQVIVREGQVIDGEIYRQLELAGLLTNQTAVKPMIAIALFSALVMLIIFMHFTGVQEDSMVKKKRLSIVLVVYFLMVVMMKLIGLIEPEFDLLIAFLFPTAFASVLIKLLINDRAAIMTSIITAATAGILLQDGYAVIVQMEIVLYILFGSLASLYLLGNVSKRSAILRTSIGVSICNLIFIGFYLLMTQTTYELSELIFYAVAAFVSGILSSTLTIGVLPFFETSFGILSDMKLIELSSPNHPLLKKILTEAPGTYHHSVMVANLADAACESIGAHGLLARVGAYYHDIGKTVRPHYFIENQHAGRNPHDALPPQKSKDIIIAHAEDGAKILEKHKMPIEIVNIARQHHGTSLLKFFVFKAKELGEEVIEADFRYAGPKPQTKEIAVISIADSVEAAVRSMKEPTKEKIQALVQAIISDKLKDGQFDECDLSMKELKKVERTLCKTLNGTFHNRIEYPEESE